MEPLQNIIFADDAENQMLYYQIIPVVTDVRDLFDRDGNLFRSGRNKRMVPRLYAGSPVVLNEGILRLERGPRGDS